MGVIINITHDTSTNLTDASNYTSSSGANISIASDAALAGSVNGLKVVISSTTAQYAVKTVTADTSGTVRIRAYIDPNSITMANNNSFVWARLINSSGDTCAALILDYSTADGYEIGAWIYTDAGADNPLSGTHTITDAPHYAELLLVRATTSSSNDGYLQLWIDGVSQGTLGSTDNYDRLANFATLHIGARAGIDAGTSGTFYLDEVVINNDGGLIGPVVAAGQPTEIRRWGTPTRAHYDRPQGWN